MLNSYDYISALPRSFQAIKFVLFTDNTASANEAAKNGWHPILVDTSTFPNIFVASRYYKFKGYQLLENQYDRCMYIDSNLLPLNLDTFLETFTKMDAFDICF